MTEPARAVTSLGVVRAKKLLEDMTTQPFCVILWTPTGLRGVTVGLTPGEIQSVQSVIQELNAPSA